MKIRKSYFVQTASFELERLFKRYAHNSSPSQSRGDNIQWIEPLWVRCFRKRSRGLSANRSDEDWLSSIRLGADIFKLNNQRCDQAAASAYGEGLTLSNQNAQLLETILASLQSTYSQMSQSQTQDVAFVRGAN